jgi:hypothetical protein
MSGRKYIGPFSSQPVGSDGDISLHGQTAAIGATGILGANAPVGLYRVSLFHAISVAGSNGFAQLVVKAFQEGPTGASSFALPPLLIGDATSIQSGSFIISSNGTADITYEVDFSSGAVAGSLSYSLRVVLEQLTNQA